MGRIRHRFRLQLPCREGLLLPTARPHSTHWRQPVSPASALPSRVSWCSNTQMVYILFLFLFYTKGSILYIPYCAWFLFHLKHDFHFKIDPVSSQRFLHSLFATSWYSTAWLHRSLSTTLLCRRISVTLVFCNYQQCFS